MLHRQKSALRENIAESRRAHPSLERSEREQERGVPRVLVGLGGVLDAGPDRRQQVKVLAQIVAAAGAEAGGRAPAARRGCLVEQLDAELQLRQDLAPQRPPAEAKTLRAGAAIDRTAAAAEGGPALPILLQPDRQQERGMPLA